jgi:antimicrobial peptide system SdpB family protein
MLTINPNLNSTDLEYYSVFQVFDNLFFSRLISIAILFSVIIGFFPRITGVLHSWIAFSYLFSSGMTEGGDQITHIIVFLLVPILIFDKRKNHWHKTIPINNFYQNMICFFSNLLIQIQFFIIYFFASTGKFNSPEWANGTALYYWFSHKVFGLNDLMSGLILPFFQNAYILVISTWSVLLIELLLAYSVFSKSQKFRRIMLYVGLVFHIFIGLFFGLWSFFFAMAGLLTYVLLNSQKYE